MFTTTSEFKVPEGRGVVRAMAVGGGGCGNGRNGGGGGSGKVRAAFVLVTPGSTVPVIVGAGGQSTSRSNGSVSSFLYLKADGGECGGFFVGGNGGSGGGAGGIGLCLGSATSQGGSGGSDGKTCTTYQGGKGQGSYTPFFSWFKKSIMTAGEGGEPGLQTPPGSGATYIAGGGAGGVLIEGKGPQGGDGVRKFEYGTGAKGGLGYGAGGGAGGADYYVNYAGGNGAPGMVYLEWG